MRHSEDRLIYGKDYLGFVYIWRDSKRNRYYIGSHMGSLYDGYVCSSKTMKRAYKKRPDTFTRAILELSAGSNAELRERETYWLSMIKEDELGVKYYNRKRVAHGGAINTPEQMRAASRAYWTSLTPEQRAAISKQRSESRRKNWQDPRYRELRSRQSREIWQNPEYRAKTQKTREHMEKMWIAGQTEEANRKRSLTLSRKRWYNNGSVEMTFDADPGHPWRPGRIALSEEKRALVSKSQKGLLWFNDGRVEKKLRQPPNETWVRGRLTSSGHRL